MPLPANRLDCLCLLVCLFYRVWRHFQQYFSYIAAVSFIGGGNPRTRKNHRSVASHLSHHAFLSLHANKLDCLCPHLQIDLSTCVISIWFSCHIVAHMYIIGVLSFRRITDDESSFGFHWGSSGHSGMGSLFALFCQDKRMI